MYLTDTYSNSHTQNTEHMRFKARLYLLTVPYISKKWHNIECHDIKIISKIYFTMLNFAHYLNSEIQF